MGAVAEVDAVDVAQLARECEQACAGDSKAASELLFQRLKASPEAFAEVAEPLVKARCWDLIGELRRRDRRAVWLAPNYEKGLAEASSNVQHLSNANRSLMENFPMPDGSRLGDATQEKLVAASTLYAKQALDMRGKARFLDMLASRVRGAKRVRDVLHEADLVSMHERATKKDAA